MVHAIHAFDSHCKNGLCEKTSIFLANDKKQNATLAGYVIITFSSIWNWKQCFNLCLKNCQCLSFNFNEVNTTENCELNDANTIVEPEALREKEGVDYYEPARNYYDMKVRKLIPIHHWWYRYMCCNWRSRIQACSNWSSKYSASFAVFLAWFPLWFLSVFYCGMIEEPNEIRFWV